MTDDPQFAAVVTTDHTTRRGTHRRIGIVFRIAGTMQTPVKLRVEIEGEPFLVEEMGKGMIERTREGFPGA